MDTTPLRDAYRTLLDAAATVAGSDDPNAAPPAGEWNADQILAHVSLVSAATIAAASCVASGANTTYDNRIAQTPGPSTTSSRSPAATQGFGNASASKAEALCALGGPALSEAELDTLVPTLLLSHGKVLVDQPMPLRDLITGLAEAELPGHTNQLLALL